MPDLKQNRRIRLSDIFIYVFLTIFAIIFLYPIFSAVLITFMDKSQVNSEPLSLIPVPDPWTLANLKYLLLIDKDSAYPLGIWYLNSIVRSGFYVVFTVLSSLLCGFVFSRMRFFGKNFLFGLFLFSTLLPQVIMMTPTYLLFAKFPLLGGNNIWGQGGQGLIDSYAAILVLGLFNMTTVFLVRMSIDGMPKAMEEAAIIDGAGLWQIMFRIVFPAQKAIFTYIAVTTAISSWNDWYTPYIYTNSQYLQTMASGIYKVAHTMVGSYGIPAWPRLISIGLAMTIPCIILFLIFRRHIVEGLVGTAVKG